MLTTLLLIAVPLNAVAFQAPAYRQRQTSSLQALPAEYLEKARRCVKGKEELTWEELEEIRDNLHRERVQDFAVSGNDNVEYHMLEAELDLQMANLEQIMPDSTMFEFHEDHERVEFDGSTMDVPKAAGLISIEETMANENLWEPIGMCAAVALFVVLPQMIGP